MRVLPRRATHAACGNTCVGVRRVISLGNLAVRPSGTARGRSPPSGVLVEEEGEECFSLGSWSSRHHEMIFLKGVPSGLIFPCETQETRWPAGIFRSSLEVLRLDFRMDLEGRRCQFALPRYKHCSKSWESFLTPVATALVPQTQQQKEIAVAMGPMRSINRKLSDVRAATQKSSL